MNNLLSSSQPNQNNSTADSASVSGAAGAKSAGGGGGGGTTKNYSLLPKRMTIVYIKDQAPVIRAHRGLAVDYTFKMDDLNEFCEANASVAHKHSRFDHERTFLILAALVKGLETLSKRNHVFAGPVMSKQSGLAHTKLVLDTL